MIGDQEDSNRLPANLPKPALRALAAAGYANLDQLAKVSEAEVSALHGIGPTPSNSSAAASQHAAKPSRPERDGAAGLRASWHANRRAVRSSTSRALEELSSQSRN